MSSASGDNSDSSDGPKDLPSLFRQLVGASVSDEAVLSISDHFSSMNPSDDGIDLYSKLPPVGDPNRHDKLLDLLFADVAIRRHLGTDLSIHQYLRRYPELKREEVLMAFEPLGGPAGAGGGSNIHNTLPPPTANSALKTMGEYKLVKQLGAGGFGEVWLAEAPGGVPVAVKIIKRPIDDYTARQEHQALLLVKGLSHPCLVQTQAYWVLDDRLVIAMELCEQNLRQRLKDCQAQGMPGVPKKELLTCFKSAAEALDHLHKNRVHHRDIKPENLLLHHGHLKIADFGLAFLYESEASMMTAPEAGTGRYMAPEVWNRKLSKHSDQYSLALAYAELRLGRPIITGKGTVEFMKQHLETEPDLSGLPMDEADVVRQALAKNPHDRFESCTEFMEALAATEPEERKPRGRRWPLVLTGATLAVVLGVVAYSHWFSPPQRTVTIDAGPWTPPHGAAVGAQQVTDELTKQSRYQTIEVSRGGARVKFVFVNSKNPDVRPFYISQTKVTNDVMLKAYADPDFNSLLEQWKERVGPGLVDLCFPKKWMLGGQAYKSEKLVDLGADNLDLPVFRLTAAEAAVVSEWLGGVLPTPQQWETAAGVDAGAVPPFSLPKGRVGRGRESVGPAPAGTLADDLSTYGVSDVAGNGKEWTRTFTILNNASIHNVSALKKIIEQWKPDPAEIADAPKLRLRGFSYIGDPSLSQITKMLASKENFGIQSWLQSDPDIGFRVVIEPQ